MNREQLIQITSRHYRKLKKYFNQCKTKKDQEAIHKFRVEYKKFRAFLRMIAQVKTAPLNIRIGVNIKKCYRLLGAIRDFQLQQQRILKITEQQVDKPILYIDALQKMIGSLKSRLNKKYSAGIFNKDERKVIMSMPAGFPLILFPAYVHDKWNEMHILSLYGFEDDMHIHSIRKNLKDLYYNMDLFQATGYDILLAGMRKVRNEAYFNNLLEELGHFQDMCTAIVLLKPRYLRQLDKFNRRLLKPIKKQWLAEKHDLKNMLAGKLEKDFLS